MKSMFKNLINLGLDDSMSFEERRTLRISNGICYAIYLSCIPILLPILSLEVGRSFYTSLIFLGLNILGGTLGLVYNFHKKSQTGLFILILYFSIYCLIFPWVGNVSSYIHLYYYLVILAAIFLLKSILLRWISILVSIGMFIGSYLLYISTQCIFVLEQNEVMAINSHIISILLLTLLGLFFRGETDRYQATILESKNQLTIERDKVESSIRYASKVQSILLPLDLELKDFFKDFFIINLPKNIISGDFYWYHKLTENQAFFCVSDCTGHGVPGAFMSMLGNTLLREAVSLDTINKSPAAILKHLHQSIYGILRQENKENEDGMDLSLCLIEKIDNKERLKVTFSGAKSSILIIDQNNFELVKGDNVHLGGRKFDIEFKEKSFLISKESLLYFYSDGYADQGNVKGERYSKTRFIKKLSDISRDTFVEQKSELLDELMKFREGEVEQRDDITVIGIKVL